MQQFLHAVADEVTSRLATISASLFSRQHLANLVWAYATLEVAFPFALTPALCFLALIEGMQASTFSSAYHVPDQIRSDHIASLPATPG